MGKKFGVAAALLLLFVVAFFWRGEQSPVAPRIVEEGPVDQIQIPTVERSGGRMLLRETLGPVPIAAHSPRWGGSDEAALPVVLWADLSQSQVPHALNLVAQMEDRFGERIAWAFRHLPRDQACNDSLKASRNTKACTLASAAQCTGEHFRAFLNLLGKNPGKWDELSLRSMALEAGAEEGSYANCLRSEQTQADIREDVASAAAYGLKNNGRILVNGVPLPLGINTSGLDAVIRHELGEIPVDEEGYIEARRLAPAPASGRTGTQPMLQVGAFFMDTVEASLAKDGSSRSVAGIAPASASWEEAQAACQAGGKRMCTLKEWRQACSGRARGDMLVEGRRWPHSDQWMSTLCWDAGDSSRTRGYEAGQKPYCKSPEGVLDLTGNLWEWVGETREEAVLLGGSFLDGEAATCGAQLDRFGASYAAPWTGFRCCADSAVEETGAGIVLEHSRTPFALPADIADDRVVVHVVANGCTACRRPTAALADLQSERGELEVLMVVVGASEAVGQALVEDAPVEARALVDTAGLVAGQLSVIELPTMLVLDGQSQVLARMEGYSAQGWERLKAASRGP